MRNNKHGPTGGRGDPPSKYGSRGDPANFAGSHGDPSLMYRSKGDPAKSGNKGGYPPLRVGFEPRGGPAEVGNTREGPKRTVFPLLLRRGNHSKPWAAVIGGRGEVCPGARAGEGEKMRGGENGKVKGRYCRVSLILALIALVESQSVSSLRGTKQSVNI